MLSLDLWQAILLVCTALLALLALAKQVGKGARWMWRTMKKFSELADEWLGDETHPSLMQVLEETRADGAATRARLDQVEQGLARVEQAQAEHLQSHGIHSLPARRDRGRPR